MKRLTLALVTLLGCLHLSASPSRRRPPPAAAPAAATASPPTHRAGPRRSGRRRAGPGLEDRQGRHGVAADLLGPGAHDDRARPGPLLRRHGAAEERARHADAELHHHGRHLDPVGAVGLQLAFGPDKGGIIGGLDWIGLRGVGAEPFDAYSQDDPAPGVHAVPDDVRHHHPGAHHRRLRRAQEVLGLPALHGAVGHVHLRPAGPLGVGRRRLAHEARRAGLRRRHRRAHLLRRLGARVRDHASASARATGTSRCSRTTCP